MVWVSNESIIRCGQAALMIIGSFVGAFRVSGAVVAQIQVTHDLFAPAVEAFKLPMEMWAIALIAGSRITTSVYPTANMVLGSLISILSLYSCLVICWIRNIYLKFNSNFIRYL